MPAGLSNVVTIATAPTFSLALRADGTVVSWGNGGNGDIDVPLGLSNVVAIAAGVGQCLALQADGTVVAWGAPAFGLTNVPYGMTRAKAISSGFAHNLALRFGQLNPVIIDEPKGQFTLTGGNATFSVAAEGFPPITYQWQFDGEGIIGATNSTLRVTNAQSTNQGTYQAIVSAQFGSITSLPATLTLILPPQIVSTTPAAASFTNWINGTNLLLSVTATNADPAGYPLTYQWFLNGTNVPGATNANFTVNADSSQYDTVSVTVTDVAGSTNVS